MGRAASSGILWHMTLETIDIETAARPDAAVIWLHGLGADGNDFVPVVPELVRKGERAIRFVFPHAPPRPVTLNGGMRMRAWYDIISLDRKSAEDAAGFQDTDAAIRLRILEGRRSRLEERLDLIRQQVTKTRERIDGYTLDLQRHGLESVEREVRWLNELIQTEHDQQQVGPPAS